VAASVRVQAMRALRTFRMVEVVRSAAAAGRSARTDFTFRTPGRIVYRRAFRSSVIIGRRGWIRPRGAPWQEVRQTEDFRVAHGFRWPIF
jgi:hypothetical protein